MLKVDPMAAAAHEDMRDDSSDNYDLSQCHRNPIYSSHPSLAIAGPEEAAVAPAHTDSGSHLNLADIFGMFSLLPFTKCPLFLRGTQFNPTLCMLKKAWKKQ